MNYVTSRTKIKNGEITMIFHDGPGIFLRQVLSLLARHDVAAAARLAQKNDEHYLALLISQASSSLAFKGIYLFIYLFICVLITE